MCPWPMDERVRCSWCLKDDIYMRYHDEVWGVPEHDDRKLFAKLILDGAQAGLSASSCMRMIWRTPAPFCCNWRTRRIWSTSAVVPM